MNTVLRMLFLKKQLFAFQYHHPIKTKVNVYVDREEISYIKGFESFNVNIDVCFMFPQTD
ncbi:hypothetical protein GCM10026983_19550 [Gracilibacillus alcaliphilus]